MEKFILSGKTIGNNSKSKVIKISVPFANDFTLPKNISDLNLPAHAMKELPDSEVADLTLKFVNDAYTIWKPV